jgi:hypothetical protein
MEVREKFGFGARWRSWVTTLLSTSSTAILLNGSRGLWYKHFTGMRQGDPLSPMMFILAMEPLQRLMESAANEGLLSPLGNRTAKLRVSLYADDAAIFLKPVREEVQVVAEILEVFGMASGLVTNQAKCAVYPIHCDTFNLDVVMQPFLCPVQNFPCKYLGLPLHVRQIRRVEVQPLIDKMANKLPTWKGRFLNTAGRLKILNMVLSSLPTYFLTVFAPKKWAIKKIDKLCRGFLWKGSEVASGGHCLVRWSNVQKPKEVGGLGVLDLERFSRALRIRWLWFQWTEPDRPWVGTEAPCDEMDKQLFRLSTIVTIGNGLHTKFWESAWLDGQAPRDLAPNLYKLAWRKNNTVAEDLYNQNWTRGLWRMVTTEEMAEFIFLWGRLQEVQLVEQPDEIKWRWNSHGEYSAKSAYLVQFIGSFCSFNAKDIWRASAEGKHRLFAWLLVQSKILTADRLLARNWPCNPVCVLCDQHLESASHLVLQCVFARQVWLLVRQWTRGLVQLPVQNAYVEEWWNSSLSGRPKEERKRLATVLMYTAWNIWKERNEEFLMESRRHKQEF